jgi:hypothetical protein
MSLMDCIDWAAAAFEDDAAFGADPELGRGIALGAGVAAPPMPGMFAIATMWCIVGV